MATISKRGNKIVVRVYAYYDPSTRKRHEVSRSLPANADQETVDACIAELKSQAQDLRIDGTTSIGSLINYYLDGCGLRGMAANTLSAYRSYAQHHVLPRIGDVLIGKANAATFSRLFRDLQVPRHQGGAQLQAQTVAQIHAMLSGCFNTLVRDGIIPHNPLVGVKPPRGRSPEARALNAGDLDVLVHWLDSTLAKTVFDAADFEEHVFAVMVWLALHTGLRRGEIAGLNICHLHDGAQMTLRVMRTCVEPRGRVVAKAPKSNSSRRTVTLDETTADIMRSYLPLRDDALPPCSLWAQRSGEVPLFVHFNGKPWRPSQISARFHGLVTDLSLDPAAHFHTLRHTHATYLIAHGENILTVQERLGHSSSRITLDFYGHLLPGRDATAATTFGAITQQILGDRTC